MAVGEARDKIVRKSSNNLQAPIQIRNENKITFNNTSSISEENAIKVADTFSNRFNDNIENLLTTELQSNQAIEQY